MHRSNPSKPLAAHFSAVSGFLRHRWPAGGRAERDRVAEAVTAGLFMLRAARRQWRCYRHTGGAHELDIHSGVCRFCGEHTADQT